MTISAKPRDIVLVTYDDAEVLDLSGPASAFAQADLLHGGDAYRIRICAPAARAALFGGITVVTEEIHSFRGPVDTLIVTGGVGFEDASTEPALVAGVSRLAGRARRVCSVCSGTFLLATAGLLDGRRATTHWVAADLLATRYPEVAVDVDPIYVRDGDVWTSAGVTAGIDLALALIADDLGQHAANEVARWMVLPVRRTGGQSQYSRHLAATASSSVDIGGLLAWMSEDPAADLSVAALARQVGWSERHLARRFRAETGSTPAAYVESMRLDAARNLLETSDLDIAAVALRCGFGSRETMHRAFQRRLGTTPTTYRRTFST